MAVEFNAATVAAGATVTLDLPHTAAGQSRLLLFAYATFNALGFGLVSPPTCAGVPMIPVASEVGVGLIGFAVWRTTAPPAGSAPVQATWDSSVVYVAVACSYAGVHQVVPLGTPVQATANSAAPSSTVLATVEGNMVFDAVGVSLQATVATGSPHGAQVQRQNDLAGVSPTRLRLLASDELAGGNADMAWTLSQARLWAQLAVEIKAAPGGGVAARSGGLAGLKRLGRMGGQG